MSTNHIVPTMSVRNVPARGDAPGPLRHGRADAGRAAGRRWPWPSRPSPAKAPAKVKAKSVIQIFLWGGMSHNDTWDPKPESGHEYMGEFAKAIPTNVDGIQIGECFPSWRSRPTSIR